MIVDKEKIITFSSTPILAIVNFIIDIIVSKEHYQLVYDFNVAGVYKVWRIPIHEFLLFFLSSSSSLLPNENASSYITARIYRKR